jgi:hypothetical protein
LTDIAPSVLVEDGRADFRIPEHLDAFALRIVGDTGEADRLQVAPIAAQFLDEPRPAAELDKTTLSDRTSH